MNTVRQTINRTIENICEQQSYRRIDLKDDIGLVKDLGFSSLDIAQLIATLEIELAVDPFSEGVPLSDVVVIGDLYRVYQLSIKNKKKSE